LFRHLVFEIEWRNLNFLQTIENQLLMNYLKFALLFFISVLVQPNHAFAVVKTQLEVTQNQTAEENKVVKKFSKKHKGFIAKLRSGDFDFNHPVKKWLWLTIVLFLASVIFRAFKFSSFAYVLGAFALVCFIIWFLKIAGVL
jgi:hypothetical protein